MKRKLFFIIIIVYVIVSALLLLTDSRFIGQSYIDFGDESGKDFLVYDKSDISQKFSLSPIGAIGVSVNVSNPLQIKNGVVWLRICELNTDDNSQIIVAKKKYYVAEISDKNESLEVISSQFLDNTSEYCMSISVEGIGDDYLVFSLMDNQYSMYANRNDISGDGDIISTKFIMKKNSIFLAYWMLLSTIVVGGAALLFLQGNKKVTQVMVVEIPAYKLWGLIFVIGLMFLFMGYGISKGSFLGDYRYYANDEWEVFEEDDSTVFRQTFVPIDDELVRILFNKADLSTIEFSNTPQILLMDGQGTIMKSERIDFESEYDGKYVVGVWTNRFMAGETYSLEIRNINSDKMTVEYQYRPKISYMKVGLFFLSVCVTMILLFVPLVKPLFSISRWEMVLLMVISEVILLLIPAGTAYIKYRKGVVPSFFIPFTYVLLILGGGICVSAFTRFFKE